MVSGGAIVFAATACLILLALSIWAHYRFAGYDRLPRQFGFSLKPVAYGPRWMMVWFLPLIFIAMLGLFVFLPGIASPENINGNPDTGVMIASILLPVAHVFSLWLLVRWARGEG